MTKAPEVGLGAGDLPGGRAEATRGRIMDTAEAMFRSMGYQKTAVADIARELGMSPANIYRFFASKSAINEAIAARILGGLEEQVWQIARGQGPAEARLRGIFRHLHKQHMALFFQEKKLHDMVTAAMAEHWGVIEAFMQAVLGAVRHVLMDGMAAGEFARGDAEALAGHFKRATLLWCHPVLIAECIGKMMDETALECALDGMLDFLVRGLRPDK